MAERTERQQLRHTTVLALSGAVPRASGRYVDFGGVYNVDSRVSSGSSLGFILTPLGG